MFLSPDQLRELTGYKLPAAQIRWLTRNGIKHWVARTGHPVVPASVIDGQAAQDHSGGFRLGQVA